MPLNLLQKILCNTSILPWFSPVSVSHGGFWFFGKTLLHLCSWCACFNATKVNRLPIWVCLPQLPLEIWDDWIIRGIAGAFSDFISIDNY